MTGISKVRNQVLVLSFCKKVCLKKSPRDLVSPKTMEKQIAVIMGIKFIRMKSKESPKVLPSGKNQRTTCPTRKVARRAVSAYQIATDCFEINLLIFPPLHLYDSF